MHAAGAKIVGGNIARGGAFSCTLTVIGHVRTAVRRSGARVGDNLYVTGVLGGPASALASWERQEEPEPWALQRFLHPLARLAEGQWLAAHGATAMIDISDGIAAEARHLSSASGVHCVVNADLLPTFERISPAEALRSGEEYELLVALPADAPPTLATEFQQLFGIELTRVGQVEAADDVVVATNSEVRVEFADGHDHFSSR